MLVWLWSADIQHRGRLCLVPMTVLIILLTSCFQVICDETYEFPRKSLDALASLGLLGLIVPKELGGLGQSHVCAAMVVETIARYGCPSTAMVYGKCTYWLMVFITCFTRQIARTHSGTKSDRQQVSRYNITTLSHALVTRIEVMINRTCFITNKLRIVRQMRMLIIETALTRPLFFTSNVFYSSGCLLTVVAVTQW